MREELVKRLREQVECDKKIYPQGVPFETLLLDLAADAIEELQKRVPKTPHGRLIDADALNKAIRTDIMGGLNYEHFIETAPTIIESEREDA